jgi:hypothetical protein
MHSNVHYSVGVLIATIAHYFFVLPWYYFLLVVFAASLPDLDIFLKKWAKQNNHRNFFTHTIYPGIILLGIGIPLGIFFNIHVIWLCGVSLSCHIFMDCIDWETRLFYGKRYYGWMMLVTEEEKHLGKTFDQLRLESDMDATSFAVDRYYSSTLMLVIGISLAILSFLLLFTLASEYWYIFIGYFILLEIHLYQKKRMEKQYKE